MTPRPDICAQCGQVKVVVSEVGRPAVRSFEPGPWVITTFQCGCRARTLEQRHGVLGQPSLLGWSDYVELVNDADEADSPTHGTEDHDV